MKGKLKNKPRGTKDVFSFKSLFYQKINKISSEILQRNCYELIILPTYEHTELFVSSLEKTSDIVNKEMFTFLDRKGRSLTLRPEGTTGTVRLVSQNNLLIPSIPLKLYYWGSMFRYERPQRGRYREFCQLGVELINSSGEIADFEILRIASELLKSFGVKIFTFRLNYLGSDDTKEKYKKELRSNLEGKINELCLDCQKRYETNALRILDCFICSKKYDFPSYQKFWSVADRKYIKEISKLLNKFSFSYAIDQKLVRGLDYYTGLVFEISLDGKNSVLGGGRYDKIFEDLGGKKAPAIGFAFGIDRLIDYLFSPIDNLNLKTDVFLLVLDKKNYLSVISLANELRTYGYNVDYNLIIESNKKKLFKNLNHYSPKLTVVFDDEFVIKDHKRKKKFIVAKEEIITKIRELIPNRQEFEIVLEKKNIMK